MLLQTGASKSSEVEQPSPSYSLVTHKRRKLHERAEQSCDVVQTTKHNAALFPIAEPQMPMQLAPVQSMSTDCLPTSCSDNNTARGVLTAAAQPDTLAREDTTFLETGMANTKPADEDIASSDAAGKQQLHAHQAVDHHQTVALPNTAHTQLKDAAASAATQFRGNVKRVRDAETFQRQKERRQKKAAFLLDGTTTGPVVGVAKGGSWGQAAQQHAVRLQSGHMVQLPVRPNRLVLSQTASLGAASSPGVGRRQHS